MTWRSRFYGFANRHPVWASFLLVVFLYLIVCCLFEVIVYWNSPERCIYVVNPGRYHVKVVVRYVDGSSQEITVLNSTAIKPDKPVSEIIYTYWEKERLGCSGSVKITHNEWIWLYIFPPDKGGLLRSARSYSVFQREWKDSPFGLAIMVGTENAYVEESLAGRMFLAYYGLGEVMKRAEGILDKMNISDSRIEMASTALWAAQLVREAKHQAPIFTVNARGLDHVVGPHLGFFMHPLQLLGISLVRFVDKDDMYIAILRGVKMVKDYIEVFPEWKKVDESNWVELCHRMEDLTVEPVVPSYAHTLVLGALVITMPLYAILAAVILIGLLATLFIALHRVLKRSTKTRRRVERTSP